MNRTKNKRPADFDFLDSHDFGDLQTNVDIENDEELQEELRALGWTDEAPRRQERGPIAPIELSDNFLDCEVPEIERIGEIDESTIEVTEDDMKDPELLSQLHELSADSSGGDSKEGMASDISGIHFTDAAVNTLTMDAQHAIDNSVEAPTASSTQISDALEAKREALRFKKLGNNTEAIKWLRIAKRLESGESTRESSNTLSENSTSSPNLKTVSRNQQPQPSLVPRAFNTADGVEGGESRDSKQSGKRAIAKTFAAPSKEVITNDSFGPLEIALKDAIASSLKEAKRLKSINPQAAVEKMREYKQYGQELGILETRRKIRNAEPALYHYDSNMNERVVENLDISDEQIVVFVEGVYDLAGPLQGQSSRSITVNYDIGIPKDNPVTGKINATVDTRGIANIDTRCAHDCIKRSGKAVQLLVARKKATFEVILNRGFFFSAVSLGVATMPLADLLTKCECGGLLPLFKADGKKNGAAGSVRVALRLRRPLQSPEVIRSEERKLVIDFWPPVQLPPGVIRTASESIEHMSASKDLPKPSIESDEPPSPQASAMPSLEPPLSAREIEDPFGIDFIVSNDVLEAELQSALAALESAGISPGTAVGPDEDIFSTWLRVQLIQNKIQILISDVQNEKLTMDAYLNQVENRIIRDQYLLAHYRSSSSAEADPAVVESIEKRISIMRTEVANAKATEGT